MAWFVMSKDGEAAAPDAVPSTPDGGLYRVVSEPLLSKSGRIRHLVCGPPGRFALSASKNQPGPPASGRFSAWHGETGSGSPAPGRERRAGAWTTKAASTSSSARRGWNDGAPWQYVGTLKGRLLYDVGNHGVRSTVGSRWNDTCLGELSFIRGTAAGFDALSGDPFFSPFLKEAALPGAPAG